MQTYYSEADLMGEWPAKKKNGHECSDAQDDDDFFWDCYCGPAVECCYEDTHGYFWVSNGEYGSRVRYCPFCGAKGKQ